MTEINGLVPSRPDEFRKASRKVVELPNAKDANGKSLKVEIRKLTGFDFLEAGTLPMIAAQPNENREAHRSRVVAQMKEKPDDQRHWHKLVVTKGVTSPAVVDVEPANCPPDKLCIADLGIDQLWLFQAILDFSGLTEETARIAGKFPEEPEKSPVT